MTTRQVVIDIPETVLLSEKKAAVLAPQLRQQGAAFDVALAIDGGSEGVELTQVVFNGGDHRVTVATVGHGFNGAQGRGNGLLAAIAGRIPQVFANSLSGRAGEGHGRTEGNAFAINTSVLSGCRAGEWSVIRGQWSGVRKRGFLRWIGFSLPPFERVQEVRLEPWVPPSQHQDVDKILISLQSGTATDSMKAVSLAPDS